MAPTVRISYIVLAALTLASFTACGGGGTDKFDQTWSKKIADTTCADWTKQMNAHERFVMSADLIAGVEGSVPKDAVINERVDAISGACESTPKRDLATVSAEIVVYGGSSGMTRNLPYELDPNTLSANVSAKRFGKVWPLTLKSGIVNCAKDAYGVAVIFQPSRSTANHPEMYALNGYAKGSKTMEFYGLRRVDPIWADDPEVPGTKKDIGVLIDICQPYF